MHCDLKGSLIGKKRLAMLLLSKIMLIFAEDMEKGMTPVRSIMLESCYYKGKIEAGCDEAGRGCLAGSV